MVTTFLALITAAVLSGQDAPVIVTPTESRTACLMEAAKLNHLHAKELDAKGARLACLSLIQPTV